MDVGLRTESKPVTELCPKGILPVGPGATAVSGLIAVRLCGLVGLAACSQGGVSGCVELVQHNFGVPGHGDIARVVDYVATRVKLWLSEFRGPRCPCDGR